MCEDGDASLSRTLYIDAKFGAAGKDAEQR